MKKTYKIEVDCANCANLMEDAAKKTGGVEDAVVNFMTQKMTVQFEDGREPKSVMKDGRTILRDQQRRGSAFRRLPAGTGAPISGGIRRCGCCIQMAA